jgi:hypothetical protein
MPEIIDGLASGLMWSVLLGSILIGVAAAITAMAPATDGLSQSVTGSALPSHNLPGKELQQQRSLMRRPQAEGWFSCMEFQEPRSLVPLLVREEGPWLYESLERPCEIVPGLMSSRSSSSGVEDRRGTLCRPCPRWCSQASEPQASEEPMIESYIGAAI